MPDTASNIIVQTVGNTANIATDYGTSGVGVATAHVPLQKMMFGNSGAAIRVSSSNPLPVTVASSAVALSIAGNVGSSGAFEVSNYNNQYMKVAGSTAGAGITVQGAVSVTAGSYGIHVTGGILVGLSSGRDTVGVTGTVSLLDRDGTTGAPVKLYSGLTAIGVSGNALLVEIAGAGFTADITLSSIVGVTNGTGPLKVEGKAGAEPIAITGSIGVTSIHLPMVFTAGQKAVTTTGLSMPSHVMGSGAKLKALSTNTSAIYLGHTSNIGSTLGYPLLAGESCFLEVRNLDSVYVIGGATGQTITYFAS